MKQGDIVIFNIPASTDLSNYDPVLKSYLGYCDIFEVHSCHKGEVFLKLKNHKLPSPFPSYTIYDLVQTEDGVGLDGYNCCVFPLEFCTILTPEEAKDFKTLSNL